MAGFRYALMCVAALLEGLVLRSEAGFVSGAVS